MRLWGFFRKIKYLAGVKHTYQGDCGSFACKIEHPIDFKRKIKDLGGVNGPVSGAVAPLFLK